MDCKTCKESIDAVSRHIHEADLDRMERVNHRLFVMWVITFVLLLLTVGLFVWRENQFERVEEEESITETTEIEQYADESGINQIVGGDYYGNASKD